MKIGIDFGSTYSTVSVFEEKENALKTLTLVEGESASIPSVVAIANKTNKVTCGHAAKNLAGKKTVKVYEVFKMLLNENDKDLLMSKGYDSVNTPQKITTLFFNSVLDGVMKRYNASKFESVCICIPEVWENNALTLDGRSILINILEEKVNAKIDGVKVVTEPEAASAYYAYQYSKEVNAGFNGHILLIDFGGGTLDITLTEVVSSRNDRMEIAFKESCGVGENHLDTNGKIKIGDAGVAFFQQVIFLALLDAGIITNAKELDYSSAELQSFFKDLESQAKSNESMNEIEDIFGSFGTDFSSISAILEEEPIIFSTFEYDGNEVDVTYQHLYKAYSKVIEKVLNDELVKIKPKIIRHIGEDPCAPESGKNDRFKIAIVGGFGSFYLVKKQIADFFCLDDEKIDMRTQHINAEKKELAISLGAALIVSEKVVLQKTARFAIGLMDSNGKVEKPKFAIKYHQVLEPDVPCFINGSNGKPLSYACLCGNIDKFAVSFSESPNSYTPLKIKKSVIEKLDNELKKDVYGVWNCGFSIDKQEIITFHLIPSVIKGTRANCKEHKIKLKSYKELFDMTEIKGE